MNRNKVFLGVSLIIAFLDIFFVAANYLLARDAIYEDLSKESQILFHAFQATTKNAESNLLLIASIFANDEHVQELFQQGSNAVAAEGGGGGGAEAAQWRQALYEYVSPRWQQAMRNLGARQLHFHLAEGTVSFLRVHRPSKFGDRLDAVRFTLVDSNKLQSPRSGFETGRVYSGIRGVVPIIATDPGGGEVSPVGTLEAGLSFDNLVKSFAKATQTHVTVLLSREHINAAMWPDSIAEKFAARALADDSVIEASSRAIVPALFSAAFLGTASTADAPIHIVRDNGAYWYAMKFPLRDYLGQTDPARADAGSIVLWKDITVRYQIFRNTQWFNLIYAVLAFIAVELVLYLALQRVTGFLEQQVESRTAELNASHDRLRTLIDATPDLICFKDGGGLWLEANQAIREFFGLRDHEYQGKNNQELAERVHLAFHDTLLQAAASDEVAWEERQLSRYEETLFPPQEPPRTFDVIRAPIFDGVGARQGMVVLARDISERQRAMQALESSEARYRRFFTHNKAPMLLVDPEDCWIVAANQAASRFYGYTMVEMRQLNLCEINMQTETELTAEKALARRQRRDYLFGRHMMKNGEIRYVAVYSGSMELDERRLIYCIIHDVTVRHHAGQALKASEAKYKQLFDHAPMGILLLDAEGRTLEVNPPLCALLGYSARDMIGKPAVHFIAASEPHRLKPQQSASAESRGEQVIWRCYDGRLVTTLFNSANLLNEDGETYAILAFVTELTAASASAS